MRTARGGPGRGVTCTRGGRHPALAGVVGGASHAVGRARARAGRPTRVWARCRAHEGAPVTERRTAPTSDCTSRCYVLDTSVLLSDPWSLTRFDEHEVVLPLVVISELEGKRHHPELGWFARTALRQLDELRIEHGRLDAPVPIGTRAGPCTSSSTTPTRRCSPRASAPTPTTAASWPARSTSRPNGRRRARRGRARHEGHAAAGEGGRGRACTADEYHAPGRRLLGLDRDGRPGGHRRRRRHPVPRGRDRPRRGARAAVQHRAAAAPAVGRRRSAG